MHEKEMLMQAAALGGQAIRGSGIRSADTPPHAEEVQREMSRLHARLDSALAEMSGLTEKCQRGGILASVAEATNPPMEKERPTATAVGEGLRSADSKVYNLIDQIKRLNFLLGV